ncbi:ABC transporter permease [Niallia sp. Krafla_26]|uniref:ABC transporter permease n=1 Tax=Niallia sp. Krafla_26 TaxID=3064703 RepID=UPI003D16BD99
MKSLLSKSWRPLLVLLLLFILWETAVIILDIPNWLLPAPNEIFLEATVNGDDLLVHLISTLKLTLTGFSIGTCIGLITAIFLYLLPKVKEAVYPLLILSQNIPTIVLAPLLVIWFGFGLLPKIIVISLVCFFPVTVAALDGFKQTPAELKHYLAMAGANKQQLFWKLEFPYALPAIFSGIKISATYSVMGAVISEWLGAKEGIGVYMTLASSSFRTDRVFVAIFTIMILSLLLFAIIQGLERITVRWHHQGEDMK